MIRFISYCTVVVMLASCSDPKPFDIQGHRGCRGLMPENTIPAFQKAVELGVTTLEMDLAVTVDGELVVSHEPYFSSEISLDTAGNFIPDSAQLNHNIFKMPYSEVKKYDCGLKPHPRFPEQQKIPVAKPLLMDVFREVEAVPKASGKIRYNIEIKSQVGSEGVYHPTPADFSDLVFESIRKSIGFERITIQSFDFRVLQYFHGHYPEVTLALLIENKLPSKQNLDSLGFIPAIYSCDFDLLSRPEVRNLQDQGMKVIPWTVNEVSDMKTLIDWGVDGLITDYPDRYFKLKE